MRPYHLFATSSLTSKHHFKPIIVIMCEYAVIITLITPLLWFKDDLCLRFKHTFYTLIYFLLFGRAPVSLAILYFVYEHKIQGGFNPCSGQIWTNHTAGLHCFGLPIIDPNMGWNNPVIFIDRFARCKQHWSRNTSCFSL